MDPEYFNMDRKSEHFTQKCYMSSYQSLLTCDEFILLLNENIDQFCKNHSVSRKEVTAEIISENKYAPAFAGLRSWQHVHHCNPFIELRTVIYEDMNVYANRVYTELLQILKETKCFLQKYTDMKNLPRPDVSLVSEDKYKEKRDKALRHLTTLSITDPTYEAVWKQVQNYSSENLLKENNRRRKAACLNVNYAERRLIRENSNLQKIKVLFTRFYEIFPEYPGREEIWKHFGND